MIIQEFSFGNFRSFKDIQTLNLASAKIKSKYETIDEKNLIIDSKYKDVSFLKSKAIYGANASGKSNIVKAFVAFIRIIKQSVKDEEILNIVEPFRLSTETENEPSFFQLIFWVNNIRYRYGFELDKKKIFAEWLYAKPGERELPLFIRDNQEIVEIDKTNFSEGNKLVSLFDQNVNKNEIFRENSLFLSSISSLGFGKLSKELVDNIASISVINGLGHSGLYSYAGESLNDEKRKKYIVDFLKYGDTGIEDIGTFDVPSDSENKNDSENEKKKIQVILKKCGVLTAGLSGLRQNSIACVALNTCGLAFAEAERYLPSLITKIETILNRHSLFNDEIVIRMTGCPNGCGRPYLAEIGFVGKSEGHYNLYLGGNFIGTRLNTLYKETLTEDEILTELEPIITNYALNRFEGEKFGDFVIRKQYVKETHQGKDFKH